MNKNTAGGNLSAVFYKAKCYKSLVPVRLINATKLL